MNPIDELVKECDGFLEEDDLVCDNNVCFNVEGIDCVVLDTDKCLESNSSCDFTVFIANNNSLDVVQIEAKEVEQNLEVIEPKFKYSDALALLILSSICNLVPMSCRFTFIQIINLPNTSPGFVSTISHAGMQLLGGSKKTKIRIPGGKFEVGVGFCDDHLQDLLDRYPPRERGAVTIQDYIKLCKK